MIVAKKELPALPEVEHIPLRDLPIDDIWRAHVKAAMKQQDVKQHLLADHVGCAQGNISQVLSTAKGQSRSLHTQRISVALGIPMTMLATAELAVQRLIQANPGLAKTQVDSLVAIANTVDPE